MLNNFNFIKEITEAHGVPGSEEDIRRIIKNQLESSCEEFFYDNLGSIICKKNNSKGKFKVAIVAHMDEVGFLVEHITKDGYIKPYKLGGVNPLIAYNNVVQIKTEADKIMGVVIGKKTISDLKWDDLLIDIGCSSKDEVLALGINIGDPIAFTTETKYINNKEILAKSWDDRVGCILGVEILKELKNIDLDYDLYFVGSVQEEIGTRGGKTSMELLNPDLAIILDVANTKNTPDNSLKTRIYGDGPCLVVADKLALGNKKLIRKFANIGDEKKIKYQYDFLNGGGTDNGPATMTRYGIAGLSIILPVKNCHTPNTLLHEDDYISTFNLLKEFFMSLNKEMLEKIYEFK